MAAGPVRVQRFCFAALDLTELASLAACYGSGVGVLGPRWRAAFLVQALLHMDLELADHPLHLLLLWVGLVDHLLRLFELGFFELVALLEHLFEARVCSRDSRDQPRRGKQARWGHPKSSARCGSPSGRSWSAAGECVSEAAKRRSGSAEAHQLFGSLEVTP